MHLILRRIRRYTVQPPKAAQEARDYSHERFTVIHIPVSETEIEEYYDQGLDDNTIRKILLERVKLLENEIVLMESLKSAANVVSIEDHYIETSPEGIGWTFYIRMEMLESLTQYLKRVRRLTQKEVIKLGIDISNALVCCEEANIIHRDIKPGNIFRSKYGEFKLGDFGIARRLEGKDKASTQIGTPSYEAPEIVLGRSYDHTVDIYALGIVLYSHLNHGRKPFIPPYPQPVYEADRQSAARRRLSGEMISLPDEADRELGEIVLKALAFNPKERYQNAAELRDRLKRYEVLHVKDETGEEQTVENIWHRETRKSDKKSTWQKWMIAAGIGTFALIGGIIAGLLFFPPFYRKSDSDTQDTISQTRTAESEEKNTTSEPIVNPTKSNTPTSDPSHISEPTEKPETTGMSDMSPEPTEMLETSAKSDPSPAPTHDVEIGQTIYFGIYEQDGDDSAGKEDIEWIVLDKNDTDVLVISKYGLDCQSYNDLYEQVTWEDSSIRTWLNGYFLDTAFTSSEKDKIKTTLIKNMNNPKYGTQGGNDTKDKVFLLSYNEAKRYFENDADENGLEFGYSSDRACKPTEFAKTQGAWIYEWIPDDGPNMQKYSGNCWWWLRSSGRDLLHAAGIGGSGDIYSSSYLVSNEHGAIRPCLWMEY